MIRTKKGSEISENLKKIRFKIGDKTYPAIDLPKFSKYRLQQFRKNQRGVAIPQGVDWEIKIEDEPIKVKTLKEIILYGFVAGKLDVLTPDTRRRITSLKQLEQTKVVQRK